MYAVKCYSTNGAQFGDTDYFDDFVEACNFAEDMSENDDYLVDIEFPDGTVFCVN